MFAAEKNNGVKLRAHYYNNGHFYTYIIRNVFHILLQLHQETHT